MTGQSLLLFSYGQSNADVHDAGPSFTAPALQDSRIVVPDDGFGFRGLTGRQRPRDITGFLPAFGHQPEVQSIGHAAAAHFLRDASDAPFDQVIIRSGAKGGRPLLGYTKHGRDVFGIFLDHTGDLSPLLLDMCDDIRQIATVAATQGMPIKHIAIPFFHGEADRSMPRDVYRDHACDMMDVIEARLADLELPITWLLTQPSGTNSSYAGNAWANRLSIMDICDKRDNAYFVAANYAYQLVDAAHLNATSKALVGELIGVQLSKVLQGQPMPATRLIAAKARDQTLTLTFDGPNGITLAGQEMPDPSAPLGFDIAGKTEQAIRRVRQIGTHQLQLDCAVPLHPAQGELRYAYAQNHRRAIDDGTLYPFGRGAVCEDWAVESVVIPGRRLLRWVPGFMMPLSEIAETVATA